MSVLNYLASATASPNILSFTAAVYIELYHMGSALYRYNGYINEYCIHRLNSYSEEQAMEALEKAVSSLKYEGKPHSPSANRLATFKRLLRGARLRSLTLQGDNIIIDCAIANGGRKIFTVPTNELWENIGKITIDVDRRLALWWLYSCIGLGRHNTHANVPDSYNDAVNRIIALAGGVPAKILEVYTTALNAHQVLNTSGGELPVQHRFFFGDLEGTPEQPNFDGTPEGVSPTTDIMLLNPPFTELMIADALDIITNRSETWQPLFSVLVLPNWPDIIANIDATMNAAEKYEVSNPIPHAKYPLISVIYIFDHRQPIMKTQ